MRISIPVARTLSACALTYASLVGITPAMVAALGLIVARRRSARTRWSRIACLLAAAGVIGGCSETPIGFEPGSEGWQCISVAHCDPAGACRSVVCEQHQCVYTTNCDCVCASGLTDLVPGCFCSDGPDSDADGIPDEDELALGTHPQDADSDDDGLKDGEEISGVVIHGVSYSGLDPLDCDTDDDGLPDGLELGLDSAGEGTAVCDPDDEDCLMACHFIPDADPKSVTDPTQPDTDGAGLPDGIEDADHNGAVGFDETDPRQPGDDAPGSCAVGSTGAPVAGPGLLMLLFACWRRRRAGSAGEVH